ncbi:hypothetical protein BSKO_13499 [Bryopsis sp. KO-2023]|nr:hypothetical protein BSKO_13499 [Bryopsis sp. KO-2023]
MLPQRRAVHGNRKKCGTVLSDVAIFLLSSVIFFALRCEVAGAQKCDAIFGEGDFSVTRAVLDEVKDDFQMLMDCVPKRGKLAIEPGLNIKPTSTVVVKNAIEVTSSGKGEKRPVFTCPDVGQPLFEISSTGVELKNFVVSDCNTTSAVLVDIEKDKNSKTTSLEITGVDFVNNTNLNGTAGIFVKSVESLSLAKVAFSQNLGALGGGIFLDSAGVEVNVRDCVFEKNQAIEIREVIEGSGAALFQNASAFVTITRSKFLNNRVQDGGAAIYISIEPRASTLTITDTEFCKNLSGEEAGRGSSGGGAIRAVNVALKFIMKNCTLAENIGTSGGGGIALLAWDRDEIKAEIEDTVFEKNVGLLGGAIWAQANREGVVDLLISNSSFLRNEALLERVGPGGIFERDTRHFHATPGRGGAITCIGVSVDFKSKGNLFEKNTAVGLGGLDPEGPRGGAISIENAQKVTITDTVFKANSAVDLNTPQTEALGGAIHFMAERIESARVLDSPPGSKCERQCVPTGITGIAAVGISSLTLNPVAGCAELNGSNGKRFCVLMNATECEGVIPDENTIALLTEGTVGAYCKEFFIKSNLRLSGARFLDNTVDGSGGSIFATKDGANITLGRGVEFVRNTANNFKGGALVVSNGATLFAKEEILFKDNVAGTDGGGVVLEGTADFTFQGGSFIGNKAKRGNGGAIAWTSTGSNLTVAGPTRFRGNKAGKSGGAIACLSEDSNIAFTDASFSNNEAATAGGALHAVSARGALHVDLADVSFSGNSIKTAPGMQLLGKGGAISLEGAAVTLFISGEANTFAKNSAREGGAIRLFDTNKADISRASFTENVALSGGGLHASFTRKSDSLAVSLTKVDFIGNKGYMGGGLMADARSANLSFVPDDGLTKALFSPLVPSHTPQITLNGVRFEKQRIVKDGGGMFLIDIHAVGENCDFLDNRAAQGFDGGGGAVKLSDSARFDLTSGTFTGNRAVNGGALFVSNSVFNGSDLEFSKNTAFGKTGLGSDKDSPQDDGDIFFVNVEAAGRTCASPNFSVKERVDGGGGAVKLVNSARVDVTSGIFTGNQAVDGGAVFVSNSFFEGKDLDLSKNTAFGEGGSILVEGSVQLDRPMVNLVDSKIDRNVAVFGGGIFEDASETKGTTACQSASHAVSRIVNPHSVQNVVENAGQNLEQSSTAPAMSVVLNDTLIFNNRAYSGGGGIFTRDPTLVCVCCGISCSKSCRSSGGQSEVELEAACGESWAGNSHGEGGYGPLVASFESSVELKSNRRVLQEDEFLDESHNSGDRMASLTVQVKDLFGQLVTVQRSNIFAQVTSESTIGQILSGQVDSQVKGGVANFNATVLSALPGNYQMIIFFPGLYVEYIPFRVRVRECIRGENPVEGESSTSFSCRQCEADNFSFRPGKKCTVCPASTTCGTGTLTPVDGYWHSSSWSESIHQCLVDVACSYINRSTILGMESERSGPEPLHFTNHSLCREGYEGPLCGSCVKGYGRIKAFECQECLSQFKTISLVIAIVFWMVIIVGFMIRNALKAGTPAKARVNSEREGGNLEHSPAMSLGVNPATENAKILINFLQVTSIALAINVEWREEVRRVLQLEDLAAGFSANEGIFSFDCSLAESGVPVSIRGTILAILLPFTMMVFPVFFALKGCFDKPRSRLRCRKAFVSSLVVAFLFYTGTTKRALRILQGVSVDPVESNTMFAQGRFWAGDTNIGYFEGDHGYLAIFLGVPVLVIFSFGFPACLFYVLWGNKEKLNDESFARTYGFLYRAYHNKCVYWEIVIMARKALLVGVVVFAYELGGNLQSVFAVMVLMAALILHLISQPYREELSQMNHRETSSLCVSVLTYMAGIAFNDDRLPVWSEILLSVLLVGATNALVIYLVWALAAESARHLTTLLEEREIVVPENATTWQKMRLLVNYYWLKAMHKFWVFVEQAIAWKKGKESQENPAV